MCAESSVVKKRAKALSINTVGLGDFASLWSHTG